MMDAARLAPYRPKLRKSAIGIGLIGLGLLTWGDVAAGGQAGTRFYDHLPKADVTLAWKTLQRTLETRPSREIGSWRNPANHSSGSITPIRTYRIRAGTFCRDYRETIIRSGDALSRVATACRNGEGVWILVEP